MTDQTVTVSKGSMMTSPKLTVHERMEIQMQYAVPLLRDLQEILGTDVVTEALRSRLALQQQRAEAAAKSVNSMREQAVRIERDFERFAQGGALDYTVLDHTEHAAGIDEVAVNVSDCQYATMMDRLDATDLGTLLICGPDLAAAAAGGMELQRSQTRMEGADHCDFRFRAADRTSPGADGADPQ